MYLLACSPRQFLLTGIIVFQSHFVLAVVAENGRLRHLESIAKKFAELTMAHRGEMKAIVTTVIVSYTS